MKAKKLIYLFAIMTTQIVFSQIESNYYPEGNALRETTTIDSNLEAQRSVTMPDFNLSALIEEDKRTAELDESRPYRFGKGFDTNIDVDVNKDGEETNDGMEWSMEFYSKGALSINFVLEELQLANGAELYLYNDSRTMVYGPVTSSSNKMDGVFLTDLIFGDRVTMYVRAPKGSKGSSTFTIKRVVHSYRGFNGEMNGGNIGGSESCNNNVACFYPLWSAPGRSVALILLSNGAEHCSGCMLNTTDNSFRPYFLTAFHCADSNRNNVISTAERNSAQNWMYKFGFKRTGCSNSNSYYNWSTSNGATYRAAWRNTDFLLMELQNFGDRNNYAGSITYSGWDRSTNTPSSGASIHHPAGDLSKISAENNTFQVSSWSGTNNHWLVNFDDGVVQHGSSGAPIFNQNQRVVGQLRGNQLYNPSSSYCSQSRGEYGRFNLSWNGGGTNDTRLSNWLDPCGTGALTTNTVNGPRLSGISSIGCSPRNCYISNLPAGSTVSWSNSYNLKRVSAQGVVPGSFKGNGTGSAWIRATITPPNGCGNSYYIRTNTTATAGSTSMSISVYGNNNGWVNAQANGGSSPYNWIIYGNGGSNQVTTTSSNLNYNIGCGGGYLQVQATNSCGDNAYGSQFVSSCSSGGGGIFYISVYPNPASDQLTIERINSNGKSDDDNNTIPESITATLYDFSGNSVKSIDVNNRTNKINLDVSDLKSGNYFLKVIGNKIDEIHQIIIK